MKRVWQLFSKSPLYVFFVVVLISLALFSWSMLERIQYHGRVARIEKSIVSAEQQIATLKENYRETKAEWEAVSSSDAIKMLVEQHLQEFQPMPIFYQKFDLPPIRQDKTDVE